MVFPIVEFLVSGPHVDVFACDDNQRNALHLCVMNRHFKALCYLLHLYVNPYTFDNDTQGMESEEVEEEEVVIASSDDHRRVLRKALAGGQTEPQLQGKKFIFATPRLLGELSRSGEVPVDLTTDASLRQMLGGYQSVFTRAQQGRYRAAVVAVHRLREMEEAFISPRPSSPPHRMKTVAAVHSASSSSPSQQKSARPEVQSLYRSKVREEVRTLRPSPTRSPSNRRTGEYAFDRYYQKKYGKPAATESVQKPSPGPQVAITELSTWPRSPQRGEHASQPFSLQHMDLQIFIGALTRLHDRLAPSLKKCFYRWKHRFHPHTGARSPQRILTKHPQKVAPPTPPSASAFNTSLKPLPKPSPQAPSSSSSPSKRSNQTTRSRSPFSPSRFPLAQPAVSSPESIAQDTEARKRWNAAVNGAVLAAERIATRSDSDVGSDYDEVIRAIHKNAVRSIIPCYC